MGIKKSLTFILGFVCATALFAAVTVFAQNTGLFYVKTQHRIPINLAIGYLNANGQQSNTNVALFVDIESTTTISNTTAILNNLAVAASARANDDTAISLVVGQPQQNFMGVIQLTPAPMQNSATQNQPAPEQNVQPTATLPPATLPPTNTPPPPPPPSTNTPPPPPSSTNTPPPTETPLPPSTNTPVPPPTNTQGPPPTNTIEPTRPPTTNRNANVRTGPGVTYEWMLTAPKGSVVEVIGIDPNRDWYALNNGGWVAEFLIDNVPSDLPVIASSPTPTIPVTATPIPSTATPVPPTATSTSVPPPTSTIVPTPLPTDTSAPVNNTPVPTTLIIDTPIPATPVPTDSPTDSPTEEPTSLPTRLSLPTRETSRLQTNGRTPIPTATESDVVSRLSGDESSDIEEIEEEIEEATEEEKSAEEIVEEVVEVVEDTPEPTLEPTPTAVVLSSFQYLLDMPRIQVKLIAKDLDFDSLADDLLGQVGQVVYGEGEIVHYEIVQDVEDGFNIDARVQADILIELPDQNYVWIYYTGQKALDVGDTVEFWAFVYSRYRYYTEEGVEYLSPYLVELVTE